RLNPLETAELQRQLEVYLRKGWIRPSNSPYGAAILFAKKKDGKLRMCTDYRALNKNTVKNHYPLPYIDEMFDQVQGSKVFSKMDINKTAFCTRFGSFEYLVLPFGLTNAPATFITLMNEVLRDLLDKGVIVFMDDVCTHTPCIALHVNHVHDVFHCMCKNHMFLKFEKCKFCMP